MWVAERLEPKMAEHGAHIALGGSVLYRGTSEKDLDILVYPHTRNDAEGWNTAPLKQVLKAFFRAETFRDCEGVSQIRDQKEVGWLLTPKGKRVDFFFLK